MVNEEEIVMYLIVRNDLGMSPGKVAAQVGDGVELALALGRRYYPHWTPKDPPCAKIVLQANHSEMRHITGQYNPNVFIKVIDEGRTEVLPNSLTVLAFVPAPKASIQQDLKHLKLYR